MTSDEKIDFFNSKIIELQKKYSFLTIKQHVKNAENLLSNLLLNEEIKSIYLCSKCNFPLKKGKCPRCSRHDYWVKYWKNKNQSIKRHKPFIEQVDPKTKEVIRVWLNTREIRDFYNPPKTKRGYRDWVLYKALDKNYRYEGFLWKRKSI